MSDRNPKFLIKIILYKYWVKLDKITEVWPKEEIQFIWNWWGINGIMQSLNKFGLANNQFLQICSAPKLTCRQRSLLLYSRIPSWASSRTASSRVSSAVRASCTGASSPSQVTFRFGGASENVQHIRQLWNCSSRREACKEYSQRSSQPDISILFTLFPVSILRLPGR